MRTLLTISGSTLLILLFAACGDDTSSGGTGGSGAGGTGGSSAGGTGGSSAGGTGGSSAGGTGGSSAGGTGGGEPTATHYLGGIGPDDLACRCLDGSAVKSCTAIDCGDEPAVTAKCTVDCEDRGGFDHASCTDNAASCVGTAKLLCFCEDESLLEICQTIDCFTGNEQDAICEPACATRGGLKAISCMAGDYGCVGGPDLVKCTCNGGSTVVACGSSTCAADPNLGLVCTSACLQEGNGTESECTDDHAACQ